MRAADVAALTFDVFGTVVDWRRGIARGAQEILGPKGYELDWLAFADAWRDRYQPALERVRSGERAWRKLNDLHRENLLPVLDKFAVRDLDPATIGRLNQSWGRLDPWPDVWEGFARLKPGLILAALSNGNVRLMIDLARYGRIAWDMILGAELAQTYKPKPSVYDRAAELLDLPRERCMMVAAHPADLEAARARGFRTAFVARPDERGKGAVEQADPPADCDIVASDFRELAAKLGC